ncbi:14463_t:CDS:2, partial [Dentiscutata erythropus]
TLINKPFVYAVDNSTQKSTESLNTYGKTAFDTYYSSILPILALILLGNKKNWLNSLFDDIIIFLSIIIPSIVRLFMTTHKYYATFAIVCVFAGIIVLPLFYICKNVDYGDMGFLNSLASKKKFKPRIYVLLCIFFPCLLLICSILPNEANVLNESFQSTNMTAALDFSSEIVSIVCGTEQDLSICKISYRISIISGYICCLIAVVDFVTSKMKNSQEIRKIIEELKKLKELDEFDDIRKINKIFHEVQYFELMDRQKVILIISKDLSVIKSLVKNIKEYIEGKIDNKKEPDNESEGKIDNKKEPDNESKGKIDNKKEPDNESEKNTIILITKYLDENLEHYENKDILSNESKEMIDKTKETLLEARKLLHAVKRVIKSKKQQTSPV